MASSRSIVSKIMSTAHAGKRLNIIKTAVRIFRKAIILGLQSHYGWPSVIFNWDGAEKPLSCLLYTLKCYS